MLRNYWRVAIRSFRKNISYVLINVLGLGLGICCCILIALFVRDEWTFDRFHTRADRIFRVFGKENWGENQQFFYTVTPFPMGPALVENIPEIESQARVVQTETQVQKEEEHFSETLTVADRSLFDIFSFERLAGDGIEMLKAGKVVLSDQAAKKYFGDSNPLHKSLRLQVGETFEVFEVSAVVHVPSNSSIRFFLLVGDEILPRLYSHQVLTSAWFSIHPETYVLLREGTNPETVTAKFPTLFKTLLGEENFTESNHQAGLQPLLSIHLDNSFPPGLAAVSNPKYANILSVIAGLILLVACINFVTMAVGRASSRAREVGIRKVAGAAHSHLVIQFVGESILISLLAVLLGVMLTFFFLPLFNDLSGKQLSFPFDLFSLSVLMILLLVVGVLAGGYPAFVLAGLRPQIILKGNSAGISSRQRLRTVLVGFQLVLSIFLISSTLIMRNQLNYLRNKDLGFSKEALMVLQVNVPGGTRLPERIVSGFDIAERLKTGLVRLPGVESSCASSHDFANGNWMQVGYTDDRGTYRTFNLNIVDDDFIPTLKIPMAEGRNFDPGNQADARRGVIVNEAFVREYGWSTPLGKTIPGRNFPPHEIIGVVKDFHFRSLYSSVEPLAMVLDPLLILRGIENIDVDNSPVPKLLIRLNPQHIAGTIEQIKTLWDEITGSQQFSFSFTDQALEAQYRADQNLGKIVSIAMILALTIGGMGLYALASLVMKARTKEISIRKVLGATEKNLLLVLSRDYLKLFAIALFLSVPITLVVMNNWIQSFEYRVKIGPSVFLLASVVSLITVAAAIGYQAVRTSLAQPAETLKNE